MKHRPGRIRTFNQADKGFIPTRLKNSFFELTVCVTGTGADVNSAWEQKKTRSMKKA